MDNHPSQPKAITSINLRGIYEYILGTSWGVKVPPTFIVVRGEKALVDLLQEEAKRLEMNINDDVNE